MTRTLKEYIKDKFILSNYQKTILNKDNEVIKMFIDVASTFGYSTPKVKTFSTYYYNGINDSSGLYFYDQMIDGKSVRLAYLDYVSYDKITDENVKKNISDKYGITLYTDVNGKIFYMDWSRKQLFDAKYEYIKTEDKRKQYDDYVAKLKEKEKKNEANTTDKVEYAFIGELLLKKFYYGTDRKFYVSENNAPKTVINDATTDFGYCQHLLSKIVANA